MNRPIFETFWMVNGKRYYDLRDVAALVEQGCIACEVTATEQAQAWETQQLAEKWHADAIERHARFVQEQQYKDSPEGKAAAARRDAAAHGSRVTVCGPQDAAFSELDQFSPQQTDVFK